MGNFIRTVYSSVYIDEVRTLKLNFGWSGDQVPRMKRLKKEREKARPRAIHL